MEIKKENGKLKTVRELYEEAKELIVDELDNMDSDDALYLGNEIRNRTCYETLYENKRSCINKVLNGEEPYDILNSNWSDYEDYFTYDGEFDMTDNVWKDLDTDDLADDILDGNYRDYLTSDIKDIVDEYEELKEEIENYNPYRAMCEEVVARYMNCEADVTDLLQTLDKLAKTDEAWEEN